MTAPTREQVFVTVEYAHREWGAYDHVVHARVYDKTRADLEAENAELRSRLTKALALLDADCQFEAEFNLRAMKAELESLRKDAIPEGWCFYHADFSLQAAGKSKIGTVTFIRDAIGREWWHSLPEEQQEETPLYIYGKGATVFEAMIAAAPKEN